MDRGWEIFEKHARKSLDCREQTVSRNMEDEEAGDGVGSGIRERREV